MHNEVYHPIEWLCYNYKYLITELIITIPMLPNTILNYKMQFLDYSMHIYHLDLK